MNNALKELTNIGIPVYSPLELHVHDMTLECSDNRIDMINFEREIRNESVARVDNIIKACSSNYKLDYFTDINFFANDNSISVFDINSVQKILNIFQFLVDKYRLDGININEVLDNYQVSKQNLLNILSTIEKGTYNDEKIKEKYYLLLDGKCKG